MSRRLASRTTRPWRARSWRRRSGESASRRDNADADKVDSRDVLTRPRLRRLVSSISVSSSASVECIGRRNFSPRAAVRFHPREISGRPLRASNDSSGMTHDADRRRRARGRGGGHDRARRRRKARGAADVRHVRVRGRHRRGERRGRRRRRRRRAASPGGVATRLRRKRRRGERARERAPRRLVRGVGLCEHEQDRPEERRERERVLESVRRHQRPRAGRVRQGARCRIPNQEFFLRTTTNDERCTARPARRTGAFSSRSRSLARSLALFINRPITYTRY